MKFLPQKKSGQTEVPGPGRGYLGVQPL